MYERLPIILVERGNRMSDDIEIALEGRFLVRGANDDWTETRVKTASVAGDGDRLPYVSLRIDTDATPGGADQSVTLTGTPDAMRNLGKRLITVADVAASHLDEPVEPSFA